MVSWFKSDAKPVDVSRMVERGTWNKVIGFVGQPGAGKSWKLMDVALELSRTPAYVILHDPNGNLPSKIAGGKRTGLVRHESVLDVRAALARSGGGLHACGEVDPTPLVGLAIEVAKRGMVRKGEREFGVPVVLGIDEIVCWKDASRSHVGDCLNDLLARRRPHHVALLYGSQYPRQAHYSVFSMATELYLFKLTDRADLKRLNDGGVPEELCEQLPSLPEHKFLVYER